MNWKKLGIGVVAVAATFVLVACGDGSKDASTNQSQEEQYTDWEGWEDHDVFGQVPVYIYEGQREEPHEEEDGYALTVHGADATDCDAYLKLLQDNGWQEEGGEPAAHNHILKKDKLTVAFSLVEQDGSIVISVKES